MVFTRYMAACMCGYSIASLILHLVTGLREIAQYQARSNDGKHTQEKDQKEGANNHEICVGSHHAFDSAS